MVMFRINVIEEDKEENNKRRRRRIRRRRRWWWWWWWWWWWRRRRNIFDVPYYFFLILVVSESVKGSQNDYGTFVIPKFLLFKANQLFNKIHIKIMVILSEGF